MKLSNKITSCWLKFGIKEYCFPETEKCIKAQKFKTYEEVRKLQTIQANQNSVKILTIHNKTR